MNTISTQSRNLWYFYDSVLIKLSDDKVEEGKIFDFIDMKCGQGWEIKGFDNREVILQKNKLSK